MADPIEREIPEIAEAITQRKPALVDFVTLEPYEEFSMHTVKLSRNDGVIERAVVITKLKTNIEEIEYLEKVDHIMVSEEILDEAREWVLTQPHDKDVPDEEIQELFGISQELNKITMLLVPSDQASFTY